SHEFIIYLSGRKLVHLGFRNVSGAFTQSFDGVSFDQYGLALISGGLGLREGLKYIEFSKDYSRLAQQNGGTRYELGFHASFDAEKGLYIGKFRASGMSEHFSGSFQMRETHSRFTD